jgi:aryl-alcohol dehydrogenase-like predicted oxidoreductase
VNRRNLGTQGLEVSAQGLGCMGMTQAYGKGDEQGGLKTIDRALELGVTLLDTAEIYGPYENEKLVGRAIAGRRDRFEIATKFGFSVEPDNPSDRTVATLDSAVSHESVSGTRYRESDMALLNN